MNTKRSDKITQPFMQKKVPFRRKVLVFDRDYSAPPDVVFKQFCPSREADWINGWTAELIYTESGYAEPLCVFRTPASSLLGQGVWVMTNVEPNKVVEVVMFHETEDILIHMKLDVVDLGNGRTQVTWTLTITALSQKGNQALDILPDQTPAFVDELEYFLTHGELKPLCA